MPELPAHAIVDATADGVILIDDAGLVTRFNPACERMFGYAAAEVVGANVRRLIPRFSDAYGRSPAAQLQVVVDGGEMVGRRKNGETLPVDVSVGSGEQDGRTFFVCILRDATERRHTEDLRQKIVEGLAASNEEWSEFVHAACHDLQEPLRMVASFCGIVSKDHGERLDRRGREYLSLAASAANRMRDLLDDLVDHGRFGRQSERDAWFESSESLDQAIENLGDLVRTSGAEITREGLPRLYGNPIRFLRLMQNLVGNALKYVTKGIAPRIHVSAAHEDDVWRFSVSDNGIGIDSRHHDRIFEPFKRLHAESDYQGTGLGLAICRKVVEGFGGDIGVSSTPGQGSTFSFTVKVPGEERDHGRRHG